MGGKEGTIKPPTDIKTCKKAALRINGGAGGRKGGNNKTTHRQNILAFRSIREEKSLAQTGILRSPAALEILLRGGTRCQSSRPLRILIFIGLERVRISFFRALIQFNSLCRAIHETLITCPRPLKELIDFLSNNDARRRRGDKKVFF
ncbi:MAG: hypothetical protein JXI32_09725 [Deltaproteobacteria bacterium]|nr:hypothetical protein [Deltaproteobacteria bacterium]